MSTNGSVRRRRGAAAREEALDAARDLLLSGGPAAVTLKAVGERMGVGHANLIHHFGSAAGLQGALMDRMVRDLADQIDRGLGPTRDAIEPGRLMDVVFDAFGKGGASQLAAWLVLAGEQARAESLAGIVRDLADRLEGLSPDDVHARARARALVTAAAYLAFANGLIGDVLKPMLGAPDGLGRELALKLTASIIADTDFSGSPEKTPTPAPRDA